MLLDPLSLLAGLAGGVVLALLVVGAAAVLIARTATRPPSSAADTARDVPLPEGVAGACQGRPGCTGEPICILSTGPEDPGRAVCGTCAADPRINGDTPTEG